MNWLDWTILFATQLLIVWYGFRKSRGNQNLGDYYLGGKSLGWFSIGLSVMATQASAITFLSAPGQAYTDGMRFIQFYFGLPIALIIVSATIVPVYQKLNVYTAYEYLEQRFDLKTRTFAAILFLSQRGLAAGFTIFAPSLVLSSLLGWDIRLTNLLIGLIVVLYTVTGGTKAVSATQKTQMAVILAGMAFATWLMISMLPDGVGVSEALQIAGKTGKLNTVDLSFNFTEKYTIWSGLIGGTFLALSYFGTDQSQVGRYLTGSSVRESRLGLIFNAMFKIPMQFYILFIGVILYVFYMFQPAPVFFNKVLMEDAMTTSYAADLQKQSYQYDSLMNERKSIAYSAAEAAKKSNDKELRFYTDKISQLDDQSGEIKESTKELIKKAVPGADTNDTNYIFFTFVRDYLPAGMIGLIISVIFSASMSSTSSELNALASTTTIDIYKRVFKTDGSDKHYLNFSKLSTIFWGMYAIIFAMFANRLGTLIEAVNVIGSLVYGTILGIFLSAFYIKHVKGTAVFISAILSEILVICLYYQGKIQFLWFNVAGALCVMTLSVLIQFIFDKQRSKVIN